MIIIMIYKKLYIFYLNLFKVLNFNKNIYIKQKEVSIFLLLYIIPLT